MMERKRLSLNPLSIGFRFIINVKNHIFSLPAIMQPYLTSKYIKSYSDIGKSYPFGDRINIYEP